MKEPLDYKLNKSRQDAIKRSRTIKYEDGGHVFIPELNRYVDSERYIDYKRQQIINNAVDKALTREKGIPSPIGGPSCLYTVLDNFGNKYRVPGNQTFAENPGKFGFRPTNNENIQLGDLHQYLDAESNIPHHMTMITGFKDDKPLITYSSGNAEGVIDTVKTLDEFDKVYNLILPEKDTIRLNNLKLLSDTAYIAGLRNYFKEYLKTIPARIENEKKIDYKKNQVMYADEPTQNFRFVGTESDNLNWLKEFNNKKVDDTIKALPYILPTLVK